MKKIIFFGLLLATGCVDSIESGPDDNSTTPGFSFDTSSQTDVLLECNASSKIYFEIYDTIPGDDVQPLFASYTDEAGRFSEKLTLPAYLDNVYFNLPDGTVPTVIAAKKTNGAINATYTGNRAAITPKSTRTGTEKTVRTLEGFYAFEDLWPSKGDYDMNDVVIKVERETLFTSAKAEKFAYLLTIYSTYTTGLNNGLGIHWRNGDQKYYGGGAFPEEYTISRTGNDNFEPYKLADEQIHFPLVERNEGRGTQRYYVLLTDNVKHEAGNTFKITFKNDFTNDGFSNSNNFEGFSVFLYRNQGTDITANGQKEIHLTNEYPSELIDTDYFGKGIDRSSLEIPIFYATEENYPFAIFLAGATDADVAKLIDPANEKRAIDQVYAGYLEWVKSNGETNSDWYKKQ